MISELVKGYKSLADVPQQRGKFRMKIVYTKPSISKQRLNMPLTLQKMAGVRNAMIILFVLKTNSQNISAPNMLSQLQVVPVH